MPAVVVADYGIGNLFSVRRALEAAGADVVVTGAPRAVAQAERLVVPGVGAFGDVVAELRLRGLQEPVMEMAASGRPLLGICVGMQMLFELGEEFGDHPGLGLLPGRVRAIPLADAEGRPHKIPHVGWAPLHPAGRRNGWQGTLLADLQPGAAVYFVHSFAAEPDVDGDRLADTVYGGHAISAAVQQHNVMGCQFHPEKSGPVGLSILGRFLRM